MTDFDALDFFRDNSFISDPYPYFDHLRDRCPVTSEPHHGVMMVTGWDEAAAVYKDSNTFSSCNSVSGPFPGFPVPLEGDDVSGLIEQYRHQLPFSDQITCLDPPEHTDFRSLLMRLLTPKRLKENEDAMWRLADRQLDGFADQGECEFISMYSAPFTMAVIGDLLGMPEDEWDPWNTKSQQRGGEDYPAMVGSTSMSMEHSPLESLQDQFRAYIEDRRREPRQDVLTSIANTTFPDGTLPPVDIPARVATNLFAAGQETTVRLLGAALQRLGEDAELQRLLRNERERIPNFVEEVLRHESPVKGDFRLARRATTIGGVEIAAGTTVMVLNGAASRDPRRFECPAEFRVDRPNAREHLAFGRGIHSCPGGPLARAETRVSIERLFDRTNDIRISERFHGPAGDRHYDYFPTYVLRGLTQLHLEFTPVS
ncbi:cytochrome P450 [Pseudofrankia sp. BMG5.37]|nr:MULTISPECIES: cytochrome P450 [unclassified Pseudofrankia]MDT3439271.1 cytochrome P450 [Pseudofrankia sp. BMG5.37]OHV43778.1 cytochrome [Pseudofrankia sp. BMG5.36]